MSATCVNVGLGIDIHISIRHFVTKANYNYTLFATAVILS